MEMGRMSLGPRPAGVSSSLVSVNGQVFPGSIFAGRRRTAADAEQANNLAESGAISYRRGDVTRDTVGAKYYRNFSALRHAAAAPDIAKQAPVFTTPERPSVRGQGPTKIRLGLSRAGTAISLSIIMRHTERLPVFGR
jgi:hypothetical protein